MVFSSFKIYLLCAATGMTSSVIGHKMPFRSKDPHGTLSLSDTHTHSHAHKISSCNDFIYSFLLELCYGFEEVLTSVLTCIMLLYSVKFSIKSFRVPELYIEVPETTTVGSLKVCDLLGSVLVNLFHRFISSGITPNVITLGFSTCVLLFSAIIGVISVLSYVTSSTVI